MVANSANQSRVVPSDPIATGYRLTDVEMFIYLRHLHRSPHFSCTFPMSQKLE